MKKQVISFATGSELKDFAALMDEARRIDAALRAAKERAAATLGNADAVTIDGVTLSRSISECMAFSKAAFEADFGADGYELYKRPQTRTSYAVAC